MPKLKRKIPEIAYDYLTQMRHVQMLDNGMVYCEEGFHLDFDIHITDKIKDGGDDRCLNVEFLSGSRLSFTFLKLSSLVGIPLRTSTLDLSHNFFTNFDDMPVISVDEHLNLGSNPIKSLAGLHKKIKWCKSITIPHTVGSHVLGLMNIKDIQKIVIDEETVSSKNLEKAISLINGYLIKNNIDILSCQEEMLDAGLKEFAKM